jgi:hypothetical protein
LIITNFFKPSMFAAGGREIKSKACLNNLLIFESLKDIYQNG